MIKKLFGVVTAVLALNFLCVAGGAGYLVATKKLDREKVHAIRDLIAGPPATAPATQPSTQPTAQEIENDAPMLRLDALLAKVSQRPVTEQVDLVRAELDAQAATIERRRREVDDQRTQIATARAELLKDKDELATRQALLDSAVAEQAKLAGDAGFQKTLDLYAAMPAKKVKAIFMNLEDDTVVRYLQTMDARQAGGILKEFKTPQENNRAQALLEKMRRAQAKAD